MKSQARWLGKRLRSFVYAGSGIIYFFKNEANAAIHLAATVAVTIVSVYVGLNQTETGLVIFSIAIVWITEMVNTAIEKIMDFVSTEQNPKIKIIKDMAAGAVLVAAITAAIIGCIVFIPKLF